MLTSPGALGTAVRLSVTLKARVPFRLADAPFKNNALKKTKTAPLPVAIDCFVAVVDSGYPFDGHGGRKNSGIERNYMAGY